MKRESRARRERTRRRKVHEPRTMQRHWKREGRCGGTKPEDLPCPAARPSGVEPRLRPGPPRQRVFAGRIEEIRASSANTPSGVQRGRGLFYARRPAGRAKGGNDRNITSILTFRRCFLQVVARFCRSGRSVACFAAAGLSARPCAPFCRAGFSCSGGTIGLGARTARRLPDARCGADTPCPRVPCGPVRRCSGCGWRGAARRFAQSAGGSLYSGHFRRGSLRGQCGHCSGGRSGRGSARSSGRPAVALARPCGPCAACGSCRGLAGPCRGPVARPGRWGLQTRERHSGGYCGGGLSGRSGGPDQGA